ncbi:MAG: methyltransferase domain-containing protein [Desulfamplus sp.]|nr:methyltransferase domain-containing protein [Desulfamplus sp.]
MLLFPTKNEKFWEDAWLDAIKQPLEHEEDDEKNEAKNIRRWDRKAAGFADKTRSREALERKEKILCMLKDVGALTTGSTVLDIGAGPGNWAIPMAQAGAVVRALEPSTEMIKVLKMRADEKGVGHNIDIDQRTWQKVDVEKEGLAGKFDLVFASMTPGISNPENLRNAMKASRAFCYLSSFSGGGWRTGYKEIWKDLTGQEIPSHAGDFIYPFNYIYALGYRPRIEFNMWEEEREESIEEAFESILFFVHGNADVTPETKKKLTAYLEDHSENGIFRFKHNICHGIMLWRVA